MAVKQEPEMEVSFSLYPLSELDYHPSTKNESTNVTNKDFTSPYLLCRHLLHRFFYG